MGGMVPYYAVSKKTESGILLLYTIQKGIADGSFGIDVARLARLPMPIIARAHDILHQLQSGSLAMHNILDTQAPAGTTDNNKQNAEVVHTIRSLDLDNLSPRAVYDLIARLQQDMC